jgi:HEAT repeat protein
MIGNPTKRILMVICGLVATSAIGCADLDIMPSWVPFQGPRSDKLPGVVTPAERITELKKLREAAVSASADEKARVAQQLTDSIKTESDPLIRLEILRTLSSYPSGESWVILKAALSDSDVHVRVVACEAWGKRGDAEAVQLLTETLRSDVEADVRLAAAKSLGMTKNQAALAALGEALDDSDPAMQYRAMLSLKEMTGKDLGSDVHRWQAYVKGEKPEPQPSWAQRVFPWF